MNHVGLSEALVKYTMCVFERNRGEGKAKISLPSFLSSHLTSLSPFFSLSLPLPLLSLLSSHLSLPPLSPLSHLSLALLSPSFPFFFSFPFPPISFSRFPSPFSHSFLLFFTRSFSPDKAVEVLHTQKTRRVYLNPEPDYWMSMVGKRREREREMGGKEERERRDREERERRDREERKEERNSLFSPLSPSSFPSLFFSLQFSNFLLPSSFYFFFLSFPFLFLYFLLLFLFSFSFSFFLPCPLMVFLFFLLLFFFFCLQTVELPSTQKTREGKPVMEYQDEDVHV